MKRTILLPILSAAITASAQLFTVSDVDPLALPADCPFTDVAAVSHAGDYALLTSDVSNGLARYDFKSGELSVISDAVGAGLSPVISADDSSVAYRVVSYDDTHRRFTAARVVNLNTGEDTELIAPSRTLCGIGVSGDVATAVEGRDVMPVKRYVPRQGQRRIRDARGDGQVPVLSIDRGQLLITIGESTRVFSPCGTRGTSYIWASISPNGKRVMFYLIGSGIYTCDLNGDDVTFVADLHAPVWYDDSTIIAMNDIDGEYTQVSSELVAVDLGSGERQVLCGNSEFIAMYPQASASAGIVAFTTRDGTPYLMQLSKRVR